MVYFIAVRDDGTGSRLISLLNIFYLCDKITSSDKNVRFFGMIKSFYTKLL